MNNTKKLNIIIFGGTGDLATRMLIPALYSAFYYNNLSEYQLQIIATGRRDLSNTAYHDFALGKIPNANKIPKDKWNEFGKYLTYIKLVADNSNDYMGLGKLIDPDAINIYYLSTNPELFKIVCENLANAKLNTANSRIVLEKPLGFDLQSSKDINNFIAKYFKEEQIYRIDHYLGKESVQNLMAIRFGNTLFEALWRRQWISNIQITIAENIGIESRGDFYDKTGALRDMLQNHLLQLLCIVAMEPPYCLDADVVRNEKLKVLQSLKPITEEYIYDHVISGQYHSGIINGTQVPSYLDEKNIPSNSTTETFVALKAEIQNWRWAGVPFYLRTGKRMQQKFAEIVIQFKDIPCNIFPSSPNNFANRLIISLQPEETVQLYFLSKKPGDTNELKPVYLDLDFTKMFTGARRMDAYERLLLDVIRGNLTLFVRKDEQEAAWMWVEPILNTWKKSNLSPRGYSAGSWGPTTSSTLLARDNAIWHEESL